MGDRSNSVAASESGGGVPGGVYGWRGAWHNQNRAGSKVASFQSAIVRYSVSYCISARLRLILVLWASSSRELLQKRRAATPGAIATQGAAATRGA